ncbi:MAG TPA: AraC family transcriptional regulator [Aggregatilinea sp.]|jgi:AraC-like DNA-binding protein|uniref:AraC family transcriptional regulator n=1 Tax=Aggregatilinea sp. TaxID=2806333 RepID=UPI002C62D1FB|nr:AraC family transcriptional regulator [Aggregatilinea sp.]HML21182.1 AraC family transcriptional regulator [Aggregatilinea sp.]
MSPIRLREGFKDQILYVIPRQILEDLKTNPLLHQLLPTDIGWYPRARYHYCERKDGAEEHILILCMDGEGWFEINGQRRSVRKHEALIIPRREPHVYGAVENNPWSIHWLHFTGTSSDYFAYLLPPDVYTLSVAPETARGVSALFEECYRSFLGSFVLQQMIYTSQTLHHLLGGLFFNNRAFSPTLRTSQFHSIRETLEYLRQNLDQRLSLDDMALHARLSKSHFLRLFKEQTGYSPMDYFIHLKMQHACMLLSITNQTIHEISLAVGYDDPYYFSRIFKKVVGVSPSRYREAPETNHLKYYL